MFGLPTNNRKCSRGNADSRMARGDRRGAGPKLSKCRPNVLVLEDRICPSVFYDFDIIAQTGSGLTSIAPGASINDAGKVAFVADNSAGQSVYVGDGSSAPQIVSFANPASNRTYGNEVQINNNNLTV